MEQIQIFLMENGSWVLAAILLLICLLQSAALRRIKRLEKQLEQTRNDMVHSMDMLLEEKEELQKRLLTGERHQSMPEENEQQKDAKAAQENLIDAVLSEVFS